MKKKLEHFWYYYKWYVLFAAMVLILVVNYAAEKAALVEPDATVSFVTMSEVPQQTVDGLRAQLEPIVGDANGDGNVEIEVNVYHYDGKGAGDENADDYSAAAVHLSAELQLRLTAFFVTDEPELLQESEVLVQVGYWEDYAVLRELESQQLSRYCVFTFDDGGTPLLDALK